MQAVNSPVCPILSNMTSLITKHCKGNLLYKVVSLYHSTAKTSLSDPQAKAFKPQLKVTFDKHISPMVKRTCKGESNENIIF